MLKIRFILCEHMLATSVSLPLEQLRAAESLAKADLPPRLQRHAKTLDVQLISASGEPVDTHTGLALQADRKIAEAEPGDIIYLPALWRNPKPVVKRNIPILEYLKQSFEAGSLIAGVGTGCCFMAEAGLLDNKPATTHWHYFDQFQKWYPNVQLKRQYFITQAGNLYCTGSVNSMADLTIHFIQRYFSRTVASHVERHFFHEIRRAYESSVSYQSEISSHPDEEIIQTQIWLQDNYSKQIHLGDVADQFGMSLRNFNRRFKNATGITPLNYLQKVRMEAAKDLLQTTNLSIEEIMYKVGYLDATHFNQLFKKHHATTPGQYRTTVRAKLFSL
ncbi:HTH-type transcriptional regulator CdhR [Thalassocella blandensis]|nr:HTH-type transcriptional regulator CdhR [Thalassocella blandensis]